MVAAPAAAVAAAGAGLLAIAVFVLLAWSADARSGSGTPAALRAAAQVWLAAHGTPVRVTGGVFALLPLGLSALPVVLLARAGAGVARAHPPTTVRLLATTVAGVAVPYAVVAAVLAGASRTPAVRPAPLAAAGCAGLLAAVAVGVGAGRSSQPVQALLRRVPPPAWRALRGSAAGAGVVLTGGAVVVAAGLAWHLLRAASTAESMGPGLIGGAVLLVLQLAFVPTAVLWGAAYVLGPGFAVGAGTSVSLVSVAVPVVPAVPLLAALPANGRAPAAMLGLLAVPVVAGVVATLVAERGQPHYRAGRAAAWGAGYGVGAALLLTLAMVLADGPAGPGRLALVGPSPWQVGLAAVVGIGVPASATGWLRARWTRPEAFPTAQLRWLGRRMAAVRRVLAVHRVPRVRVRLTRSRGGTG